MKYTLILIVSLLITSCGILNPVPDPFEGCECDYTELIIDGELWAAHRIVDCPKKVYVDNLDWILIH